MTGIWSIVNEAFRPPSMSIIGDLAGPGQRKAAFALSRLAINLGMSIGPVVGGFLAMRSFKLLFFVDGTTALLAGLILVLVPWRPRGEQDQEAGNESTALPANVSAAGVRSTTVMPYSSLLKDRRFLYFLLAMLPVELVFFQTLAAMPLYLVRDLRMTEAGFGMLLAVNTVLIILVEVPLNAAMAHWSNRHALALGALLIGLGFGGMAIGGGVLWLSFTVVVWTFGEMIFLPASAAHVSEVAPPAQSGAYMGLYSMGFSVAFAIVILQHASPSVLRAMKRPANDLKVPSEVKGWREICPDIAIRSSFVVGFPGETEADFHYLLDWLDEAQLDRVGAFRFEPVEGAAPTTSPALCPRRSRKSATPA